MFGGPGTDYMDGRGSTDVLYGETGDDVLFGDGLFWVYGFHQDTLEGGDGIDIIMGEAGESSMSGGNDVLRGGPGNDMLDGGGGDDSISGGDGLDIMDGDHGNDIITGGAGADIALGSGSSAYGAATIGNDVFVYERIADAGDEIWGFDTRPADGDQIDLRTLFDSFGYAGTTPRAAGFLTVTTGATPTDAVVWIDLNGGGDNFVTLLTLHDVTPAPLTDSYFLFQ